MRLVDYLDKNSLSAVDFAKCLGVDKSTVFRWLDDDAKRTYRPSWAQLQKIFEVTNGAVTANDFMDEPPEIQPELRRAG